MMKPTSALALAALFAVSACSAPSSDTVNGAASASPAADANAALATVGTAAPAFAATSLGGTPVHLSDYHGKVLVLNFWATWCPPCRAETPDMIKAYGKLKASDVAFLGVDTTESAPVVKSFVALKGVPYQIALAGPAAYNGFGIAYIPTTIVIDGNGIIRARWTGGVTPVQLAQFVKGARAGKNTTYVTAQQTKIDKMLAVSQFAFSGSPAKVKAEIARAKKAIAATNAYVNKLNVSDTPPYDTERTQNEMGKLELATGTAYASIAKGEKEQLASDELLGQAYADLNRFADSANMYANALKLKPNDPKWVAAMTLAYYRLHDYPAMTHAATKWTQVAPKDPDAWDHLALSHQRNGQFALAAPPYEKALALMEAQAAKQPIGKDGQAVAYVSDEALDVANVYVAMGDAANARRVFAISQKYANLIPAKSPYNELKTIVPQRVAEGMAGVKLAHAGNGTTIELTKWTGANLPGSLATTYRWRLIASAPGGKQVTLSAKNLKKDWVASFCQDRLCSPGSVTFTMPPEGVKTYEFQLVAPAPKDQPGIVSVGAKDGNWVTTAAVST